MIGYESRRNFNWPSPSQRSADRRLVLPELDRTTTLREVVDHDRLLAAFRDLRRSGGASPGPDEMHLVPLAVALVALSFVLPYVPTMILWLAAILILVIYLFRFRSSGPLTYWLLVPLIFWIIVGLAISLHSYIHATPGEGERHVREWGGGGFVLAYMQVAAFFCIPLCALVAFGWCGVRSLMRAMRRPPKKSED